MCVGATGEDNSWKHLFKECSEWTSELWRKGGEASGRREMTGQRVYFQEYERLRLRGQTGQGEAEQHSDSGLAFRRWIHGCRPGISEGDSGGRSRRM